MIGENHGPAAENVKLGILLQSFDLTRQSLRKANVVSIHSRNELASAQRGSLI